MKIVTSLTSSLPSSNSPYALTIGNFDGVHLGHRAILNRLKFIAKQQGGQAALLTFANHPSTILDSASSTPLLCTAEHKIRLLEQEGVDLIILLPFTESLRALSAETFLTQIQKTLPFDILVLGEDATIGKNKSGNRRIMTELAEKLNFNLEYLPHYFLDKTRISSSTIRECIRQGNLSYAHQLLGRPFSIYAPIASGMGKGSQIGYPTANIAVANLCLPPFGVYAVTVIRSAETLFGIANLGVAPTLRYDRKPILEVHLFNHDSNLYAEPVEVIFHQYIREEKVFENAEALKEQIKKDIVVAKRMLFS